MNGQRNMRIFINICEYFYIQKRNNSNICVYLNMYMA